MDCQDKITARVSLMVWAEAAMIFLLLPCYTMAMQPNKRYNHQQGSSSSAIINITIQEK